MTVKNHLRWQICFREANKGEILQTMNLKSGIESEIWNQNINTKRDKF